jgi:hypothetical protein
VRKEGLVLPALRVSDRAARAYPLTDLQAGCECGWRSERIVVAPLYGVQWDGIVLAPSSVLDRLARLWSEHVAVAVYRRRIGLCWEDGTEPDRAFIARRLIEDLEALDRCRCGHERRAHARLSDHERAERRADPRAGITEGGCSVEGCACRAFRFMPTPA